VTFCFIQQKNITSTKLQTSNTIFLTQDKECLNCYAWLIKKSLKYQNIMYMNSKLIYTVQKQTLLFPDKLDWHFYSWTGNLQLCTWIFWDTLSFACDYCVHILHHNGNWICCFTKWLFICRNVINGSILWQRANWLHVNTWGRIPYPLQVYEIIHLQKYS
jgi:hypothetical protein